MAVVSPGITIFAFVSILFTQAKGQGLCNTGDGDMTGVPTSLIGNHSATATSDTSYILSEEGSTNCYGVIAEWRAVVNGGCSSPGLDITFDVWRQVTPGSSYQLVGRNTFTTSNCVDLVDVGNGGTQISLRIPENSRIPIEDGNVIGWTYRGGNPIYVTTDDPPPGDVLEQRCTTSPGGSCDFNVLNQEDVQLEARLVRGPAPSIDNLDNTVDIYENDLTTWSTIFTVLASHPCSMARENGTLIVDPSTAVQLTFSYDTSQPFNYTVDVNRPGVLEVKTTMPYDFESQSQYLLPISVTGLHQTASATLTVNILDRNEEHILDNLDSSTSVSVLDTSCLSNPIFTVTFTDEDNPVNYPSKQFYLTNSTLSPPPGTDFPFVIDISTGEVFCTPALQTWTTSMGTRAALQISVTDGRHSVSGILTVDIQNTLDPPQITNLPIKQQVFEDLPPGSVIIQVLGDGPNVADIRFSLDDVSPRQYFYYFSLDDISGVITLSNSAVLDYSIRPPSPSFVLTIGIKDHLQTGTSQNLTIDLEWVNRKPSYNPDQYFVTIGEECELDSVCNSATPYQWEIPGLTLSILDRDVDDPGPGVTDSLTCGILPGFGSGYFNYSSAAPDNCTKLYQVGRIDVDGVPENRQINLTVWVKDEEGVSNNDKGDVARIYITVTNINDNTPVFINVPSGSPPYRATVPENTPGGVSLFTVTATDEDSGSFGDVTYTLEDGNNNSIDATLHFEVDPKSGVVQTQQFIDYEAINPKDVYFNIRATDGGGLSSIINAKVTITNVNDIRPVWQCNSDALRDFNDQYVSGDPCFYNDELRSDIMVNYEVLSITATDVDSAQGQITYHLLQPNRYFNVANRTGSIKVINNLDTYVKYILYCYSQDNGDPNLKGQPPLRVRVDTFDPRRQLIDIIMEITTLNGTQEVVLLKELTKLLNPWFVKLESTKTDKDKITASIYALRDNSTFDERNLDKTKQFVDKDELLDVLREDIHGTPKPGLTSPPFHEFKIILVEPTYPIWLTDTIPGIVTISVICLAISVLILGLTLGLCSRYEKCCFKKQEIPNRSWENEVVYDKLNNHSAGDTDRLSRPMPRERHGSVDTIHSLVYTVR